MKVEKDITPQRIESHLDDKGRWVISVVYDYTEEEWDDVLRGLSKK